MLDPDLVLASVVSAVQSIPSVVQQMAGNPANIIGHKFLYGAENSLTKALNELPSPSILIAYLDLIGGNFDGMTLWKHRLELYIRPNNAGVTDIVVGVPAASPMHLWWLIIDTPVLGTSDKLFEISLMSGALQPVEPLPGLSHRTDETGADFFVASLVFPEHGDQ